MIELKINDKVILSYDEEVNKVLLNNKVTKDYKAVFIPNGDDEPDFFGFLNLRTNQVHDIYGNKSKISTDKDIKL